MPLKLALIAYLPTDSVTLGFLPAAQQLGWQVTLYTNLPELHHKAYQHLPFEVNIVHAEVFQVQPLIATVSQNGTPDVVFTNSDHLQTQTALLADYFDLPGKPWKATYRCKNKREMRVQLGAPLHHTVLEPHQVVPTDHPYPVVLKPREGVSSKHAYFIEDAATLLERTQHIWAEDPIPLVIEGYLQGNLYTLETLGDGEKTVVLGGFRTTISPPPYFIEQRLDWQPDLPEQMVKDVLGQLEKLGVGFGSCHTECVWDGKTATLIEVNYRNIGDQCDLLLQDLLEFPLFEWVLKIHAGAKLPELNLPKKHATVHYLFPDQDGTVTSAPENQTFVSDGVQAEVQVISKVGDEVDATSSNPSSLGLIRLIGESPEHIQQAIDTLERTLIWHIQPLQPVPTS